MYFAQLAFSIKITRMSGITDVLPLSGCAANAESSQDDVFSNPQTTQWFQRLPHGQLYLRSAGKFYE